MRVSDLLRMSTGHQDEPKRPPDKIWTKVFLAQPVPHKPGTHFLYNTSATYMLSAIVQKATGMTVLDYLRPRLFDPLGIENPTWETSPQGHQPWRLWPEHPDGGHRPLRPALPPEGQVERQAGGARFVGGVGHGPPDLEREQPQERLGPGLWLPVLAMPPWRLSRRRGIRPVLHRPARAGCRDRHHQRRQGHAGRAEPRLGQAAAGPEARDTLPADEESRQKLEKLLAGLTLRPQEGSGNRRHHREQDVCLPGQRPEARIDRRSRATTTAAR